MAKKVANVSDASSATSNKKGKKPSRTAFKHDRPLDSALPEGFDFDAHKPLKRKDFGSNAKWLLHRAELEKRKAATATAKAEQFVKDAERAEALGDESTAKAVKKAERLISALATLEESLKKDGVPQNLIDQLKKQANTQAPSA